MARILLVEDDPVIGKGLVVQLEAAGHVAVWAKTMVEARNCDKIETFELILLDVNLPDGSGYDLCREFKKSFLSIPIVMLTARADEDSVVRGFDSGANDYVRKPFSNRE